MVPTYIRSAADFAQVVTIGVTTESLVLEFKSQVNTQKPDYAPESCRDIAQFANTDGGCLLIGIEEQLDQATNLKKAVGVLGVSQPDQLTQQLEQAINTWLIPSTFSHDIVPVHLTAGVVLAVNVRPSQHTVYLCERKKEKRTIEVVCRTSHGKKWMNPDELERHIMNGARAAKIRVEEVAAKAFATYVEVAGGYFNQAPGDVPRPVMIRGPVRLGFIGEMALQLVIPYDGKPETLEVPYEAVEAVWVAGNGAMNLLLSVRVLHLPGLGFTLMPYQA